MTEPGGLAAFFAQPADEEPETSLAAFYAQPSEDAEDEPLHVQADRAQAEHHDAMIRDALENLGAQLNGYVTGLVVQTKGEFDRLVWLDEIGLAP